MNLRNGESQLDHVLFTVLNIFLFYFFWFQYAVTAVKGLLPALGMCLVFLVILKRRPVNWYRHLSFVIIFITIAAVSGVLCSTNKKIFFENLINIIKSCIPMIALYCYIGTSRKKMKKIMVSIALSVFAMALSLIMIGTTGYTGAIILGDLNANKFSSYLLIGVLANLYLSNEKTTQKYKLFFAVMTGIECYSQILAASRRGIIVLVFFLCTYCYTLIFVKYKDNPFYRKITLGVAFFIAVVVIGYLLHNKDSLALIQRFINNPAHGDQARKQYHHAAREIFYQNPLTGGGFGAVQEYTGMYSHSFYYELLASVGLPATIVLIFPLILQCLCFFQNSKKAAKKETKITLQIMAWMIICMFVTGITVVYIYDLDFYLLLSVLASYSHILNAEGIRDPYRIVVRYTKREAVL